MTKKETVYGLMKPKTASLGFTKDELMTVCASIAGRFDSKEEEATEEEINAEIDAVLPYLQLSQSAANRIVQQSNPKKKEPKKADKNKKKSQEEDEDDDDDDDDQNRHKSTEDEDDMPDDMPKWAKKLLEGNKALQDEISSMKSEKTHTDLMTGVKTSLKDIDEGFYSMALNGRKFASQDEADQFVSDVKDNYKAFAKKMNIKSLAEVTPPKGGKGGNDEPSAEVKARAEARKTATAPTSPIKGLPQ